MTSTLLGASLVAYFAASVLYLANLHIKKRPFAAYGTAAAVIGFSFQTLRLVIQVMARATPFANASEAIFFLSWAIAAIYLVILIRFRLTAVGALVMPLALVALAMVYRFPAAPGEPLAGDTWIRVHIIAIVASFALFVQAFCCAVFYLVQNKLLKSKNLKGMFRRLPPLETIDSLAYHLAAVGFPMLTLGIVTGIVGVELSSIRAAHNSDIKLAASGTTWAVYAVYLMAHGSIGWRGKRANTILIIGAALIALTAALHRFM